MPTLADIVQKQVTQAIIDALKDREDELTGIAKAGGDAAHGGFWGDVKSLTDIIGGIVGTAIQTVEFFVPPLELLHEIDKGGGDGGRAFGFGWLLGSIAYQAILPAALPITHAVADLAQTEIFDPNTAAMLEAKGIIDNVYGRSEAAGGNLSGEHYDKLVDSVTDRPDFGTLLELLNRGEITDAEATLALKRHGMSDFWIPQVLKLRKHLLSPADLALAFLRSEIDEATMRAYSHRLGVDDADMDTLVANTGEPPGPEQLMEALRRGFIDQARFERGIRQSRVRNEWVDVETKLRFSPMTTSDAIRAVVENYLTPEEGAAIAEQNGLIAEHWDPMLKSWGRPLSHEQMLQLYYRGQASLDDVKQAMRESDLKNKYIDQAVELGRRLVPERTIVSMLNHNVIAHDRALEMLHSLGFNTEDADSLIKLGQSERTTTSKHLNRSDILTMYLDSLLNKAQATEHLVTLGYTREDADTLLGLQDAKAAASTKKSAVKGIEASYRAHHLTQNEAVSQLVQIGLDHAQAVRTVDEWAIVRGHATRELSQAQVVHLAMAKLIEPDDAMRRLTAMGFAEQDARLWLSYEGVLSPTTNPPAVTPVAPAG